MTANEIKQLANLLDTMRQLRSVHGCSWDREQTPESLCPYVLEEAYELVDAINDGDDGEILAELGDLLFQVVFQAQIYSERGSFGLGEVAEAINRKLQRRHPHVFLDSKGPRRHQDWEQIKQQELKEKGRSTDLSSRLPANLPALKMAAKVCQHSKGVSTKRMTPAMVNDSSILPAEEWTEENLAGALFHLVCLSQEHGIDAELALRKYILDLVNH